MTPNRLKTRVKTLKMSANLLHSVKTWKMFSVSPQNGHSFTTLGLITDKKTLVAMAPCRILHWRSPVLFFNGGLYNVLHWGLSPPSLSVQTHSALSQRHVLWIVFTQFVYRVFCQSCAGSMSTHHCVSVGGR